MNEAHKKLIKQRYEDAVHEYCKAFCDKHGYYYDPQEWVGDIGGVVLISDYYINFDDIRYDIDNDIPNDVFEKFNEYTLEIAALDEGCNKLRTVNYPHFCYGLRPYSEKELAKMREEKESSFETDKCDNGDKVCGACKKSDVQTDGNYCRCRKDGKFHKNNDSACNDYH